jgi:rSAM/selenodomain-associated transferase 1
MARPPEGGAAPKTRLAGTGLDEPERRALYAAFLADTVAACRRVAGVSLKIALTPETDARAFDLLGVAEDERMLQRGDELGARERHIFEDLFAHGFEKVIIVGSDLPTLPAEHIRQAIAWLDKGTVAIGPSSDGGYYLIGLTRSPDGVPDLFTRVRWSTPHAYEDTIWAAGLAGLHVERVPYWYDVDDEEGLTRLRKDLTDPERANRAPATAEVMRQLFR